jgi:plastocyanin
MNRSYSILLICIVGAAILCVGCTTQTGSGVTPIPTTIPTTMILPTGTTMRIPTTIVTTGSFPTQSTPGSNPSGELATPTTAPGGPFAAPTIDQGERVKVTAKNFAFDRSTITVPAGSRVIIEFMNEDGVGHNVAFYTSPSLTTTIYKGEIISGPRMITYSFNAPATPGTYYFRCDLHPNMNGQFIVT